MTLEQMKKIVDGAPEWATGINTHSGAYFGRDKFCRGDILLKDIRNEISKYDTLDLEAADIPHGTIVIDK